MRQAEIGLSTFAEIQDVLDMEDEMDDYSKKVYQFGIQRGEKRGEKRGYKLGEEQGAAKFVQALLKQNKTVEEIAQQFDMTEDNVRKCAKLKLD